MHPEKLPTLSVNFDNSTIAYIVVPVAFTAFILIFFAYLLTVCSDFGH